MHAVMILSIRIMYTVQELFGLICVAGVGMVLCVAFKGDSITRWVVSRTALSRPDKYKL